MSEASGVSGGGGGGGGGAASLLSDPLLDKDGVSPPVGAEFDSFKDFNYWYPDWSVWKVRTGTILTDIPPLLFSIRITSQFSSSCAGMRVPVRAICPAPHSFSPLQPLSQFNRTLSYWIAVFYIEGSLLFTIGAACSMTTLVRERCPGLTLALVDAPYLVGGVFFTIGGWFGLLFIINLFPSLADGVQVQGSGVDHKMRFTISLAGFRRVIGKLGWKPAAGYLLYFIGAVLFNVNTIVILLEVETQWEKELFIWLPAILGSLCFLAGNLGPLRVGSSTLTDQPTNRPTDQPTNRPTDQPTKPTNRPTDQTDQLTKPTNRPTDQTDQTLSLHASNRHALTLHRHAHHA